MSPSTRRSARVAILAVAICQALAAAAAARSLLSGTHVELEGDATKCNQLFQQNYTSSDIHSFVHMAHDAQRSPPVSFTDVRLVAVGICKVWN